MGGDRRIESSTRRASSTLVRFVRTTFGSVRVRCQTHVVSAIVGGEEGLFTPLPGAESKTGVTCDLVARRCCIRTIRHPGIFGSPKDERGKRTDGYLSLPLIAGTEHACAHATNGQSGG